MDPTDRRVEATTKIIGLQWSKNQDTLILSTQRFKASTITRRTLLSFIHSHFDPLGLLAPVLLRLKIFHQDLTRTKLPWDEPIPQPSRSKISEKHGKRRKSAYQLHRQRKHFSPRFHRCISTCVCMRGTCPTRTKQQAWKTEEISLIRFIGNGNTSLHVFTHASVRAYACAVHVRQEQNNKVQTFLLFSKTRLCPISGLTIQRLELLAVLIGVRALNFVTTQLQLHGSPLYVWSDSKWALAWIQHNGEKLPRFVKNRHKEIRRYSGTQYAYVKSAHNPADIATRGTSMNPLSNNSLWFHGRPWLQSSNVQWPSNIESRPLS
uniref:RNase H domain-containing protein n=1 Tax=Toxocara canis TaxID=6265 RepID=A0A183VHE5_TOXCA